VNSSEKHPKPSSTRTGRFVSLVHLPGTEGSGALSRSVLASLIFVTSLGALLFSSSAQAASPPHPYLPSLAQSGLEEACGVATDSAGDYYAAGYGIDAVRIYDPSGHLITEFTPSANSEPPCAIAVASNGDVYVSGYTSEVVKYKPAGGVFPPTSSTTYEVDASAGSGGTIVAGDIRSIALDPASQDLYVTNSGQNAVQNVSFTGFASGDTFTLTFKGETTAPITYSTTVATLKTNIKNALAALPAVGGAANLSISGTATSINVTFLGALGGQAQPTMACTRVGGSGTCTGSTTTQGDPSHVSSYAPDGTPISATIGAGTVAGADYYGIGVYGANGDVYVTDTAHEKAYVLNPAGTQVLAEIDGSDSAEGAFEGWSFATLAVDQSNGHVFVSDLAEHHVVDEFDAAGHFVSQLGPEAGGATLEEDAPSAIAVDNSASSPNQGTIYVTSLPGNVYAFGPLHAPTHPYLPSLAQSGLEEACGVATDSAGDYYAAGYGIDAVRIYDPSGHLITEFTPSANSEPPCAIAVASNGDVYVSGYTSEVVKYKPAGGVFPPTSSTTYEVDASAGSGGTIVAGDIRSIALDPASQDLYVTNSGQNAVQNVSFTGFASGDTFTLTFKGETTAPITYSTTVATLKTNIKNALAALPAVGGAANLSISGTATSINVTFLGALGGQAQPTMACTRVGGSGTCTGSTTTQGDPSHVSSYAPDGTPISATIGAGTVAGADYYGIGVYGANGDVYVTDTAHEKAYVLNPAGTQVLAEIDGSDSAEGAFEGWSFATLAVDQSNGHVFVSDLAEHHVVDEFDAAGHFVSQLGPEAGGATLEEDAPSAIAVDNSASSPNQGTIYVTSLPGNVYAFGPLHYGALEPEAGVSPATQITQTSAVLNGTVNPQGAPAEDCHFEYVDDADFQSGGFSNPATLSADCVPDPSGETEPTAVSAAITGLTPHALYHFRVILTTEGGTAGETSEETFVASKLPTATTETAGGIQEAAATLHGTVNPEGGTPASCHFEYDTSEYKEVDEAPHGTSVSCQPNPGTVEAGVAVSADISGLAPVETYYFRVVESTDGGTAHGVGHAFTTPGPPVILGESAQSEQGAATFQARILPNGFPTTYHFEYVDDAHFQEGGFSNPATASTPQSDSVGEDFQPHFVSEPVSGLQPGITYHYRIVVENQSASVPGVGKQFTVLGGELPNNRAFELVSPANKRPVGYVSYLLPNQLPFQAAASGNKIYYPINNGLENATAGGLVRYIAERGSTEWTSTQVTPPALVPPLGPTVYTGLYRWYSPELTCGLVESIEPLTAGTPKGDTEHGISNLYARHEDGSYSLMSTQEPLNPSVSSIFYYEVRGATSDCSHVLFETPYRLLSNAPATGDGLYEWAEGTLRLAAIRPDGSIAEKAQTGSEGNGNAMSPDGHRVFFAASSTEPGPENGKGAIFVRENATHTTIASKSKTGVPNNGAFYQIPSADGSQVFFNGNYGLATNGSSHGPGSCKGGLGESGEGCDLYDYSVASGQLTDLSADANPADLKGAGVVGMLGASADGSYVYFAAQGQLISGKGRTYAQNVNGAGSYNLYLSHGGGLSFVGLISANEVGNHGTALVNNSKERTSQVTPDGEHLLFTTKLNVTGYESGGAQEAYVYSTPSDSTICVSCRPDGLPSVTASPLTFSPIKQKLISGDENYIPRSFSDDGGRVFFTSEDVLAAGGVSGNENIYEWEDGTVYLLITGRLDFATGETGVNYIDSSASGSDVFIETKKRLAPQDTDSTLDLYDIRVNGGFPYSPPPPPCEPLAEQCQRPPAAQPSSTNPATESVVGPGNRPAPKQTKCPKGKHKVTKKGKTRCVKRANSHKQRKKHRHHGKRNAHNDRRAS
jgi:sugar lactone lactonase YvrE